tara:strand:- start:4080 stop:4463 length:384 start_codon:yes stop_codon:yes gene_type:complete
MKTFDEIRGNLINENLGHMAADVYHHKGVVTYAHMTDISAKEKRASKEKMNNTLQAISSKHGRATAVAVKKHATAAIEHDNEVVSSGMKAHHKEFADKHLGGHGSAMHKAYKARIAKHGYEDTNHHK